MNKINTPLNEKFNLLAYLQKEVSEVGSFSISYLKTKQMFQISFVNGIGYKGLSPRIDDCVELGLSQLKHHYKEQHGKSYEESYDLLQSNLSLQNKVKDLEEKLRKLEEKQDKHLMKENCDFSNTEKNDTGFFNFAEEKSEVILDEPKRQRGRPAKKSFKKHAKKMRDMILCEDYKEKQKEKKSKKRRSRKSKLFTQEQIDKEITRLLPNFDLEFTRTGNSKRYKEEKTKAYKRLAAKRYNKLSKKKNNLDVKENKYNITKEDIIADMKRILNEKFDTLSNRQYVRQWILAKARVWNREYTKAKNTYQNPWR
jgi:hypothetical protein